MHELPRDKLPYQLVVIQKQASSRGQRLHDCRRRCLISDMRALLAILAVAGMLMATTAPESCRRGTLDDLRSDAVYILNRCPGVVSVERTVSAEHPRRRIVHILDFHPIAFEDLAADIRDRDPTASDADIASKYVALMDSIVPVQISQAKLLSWLARNHGVRRVHFEGMTDADKPFLAAGSHALAVPVEDADAHRRADPFQGERVVFGGPANDAREAAIVRRLLDAGPLAVVVLGAAHDLSRHLQAVDDVEYLRVAVEGFPRPE